MVLSRVLQDCFSRYVGVPALRLQENLRPKKRQIASYFREGLRFRHSADYWQTEEKQKWILERLRFSVRKAVKETSYYKALFERIGFDPASTFSFEEFATIPPLSREDVLRTGQDLVSWRMNPKDLLADSSGGSTGEPVRIWWGPEDLGWHLSAHRFLMDQLSVPRGSRIAYLWGHHLDPGANDSFLQRIISYARNERWFDCFRLSPDVMAEYHRLMDAFQPDCIIAYASALAAFAEFLVQHKISPSYPRKCIITGAEKLFASQRAVATQVFPCPVYERYGGRDSGLMGFQLHIPRSEDFVIDWPNLLVEPETVDDIEANILVTKLHADAMPMLRYRVGDVGVFPAGSRPGHPAFTLQGVIGRILDKIWLPNGSFIHGAQFPHLMKDFPVREFMVVQAEDYTVNVEVVPTGAFSDRDRSAILKIVQQNLPGISITLSTVESIPRTKANKWRPVVTRVTPK